MSLLCSFKQAWRFLDISLLYFNLQFLQGIQQTPASETMLRWGLQCTKSQIVLEGKEAILISSLLKLFIKMLVEELFGKVMNVCGEGLVL